MPYLNAARRISREQSLIDDVEEELYKHIDFEGNSASPHVVLVQRSDHMTFVMKTIHKQSVAIMSCVRKTRT